MPFFIYYCLSTGSINFPGTCKLFFWLFEFIQTSEKFANLSPFIEGKWKFQIFVLKIKQKIKLYIHQGKRFLCTFWCVQIMLVESMQLIFFIYHFIFMEITTGSQIKNFFFRVYTQISFIQLVSFDATFISDQSHVLRFEYMLKIYFIILGPNLPSYWKSLGFFLYFL